MNSSSASNNPNGWLQRFIFQFLAVYLTLFNLPFPLSLNLGETWADRTYAKLWQVIVPWFSQHVLQMGRVAIPDFINSDSKGGWVRVLSCLMISTGGALVWAWFDPRRRHDGKIHQLVKTYVRYVLGATMLSYGFSKIVQMQFPFPDLSNLQLTYAESSPTMLLWTFMGYGTAYNVFGGAAEVLGGVLLLFRRTTTLGSLVITAVMMNVVMMNLCYDVQVKLYSIHLLLFAIILLGTDLKRLADVFVFNRPVDAIPMTQLWPTNWKTSSLVVKLLLVGWLTYASVTPSIRFAIKEHNFTKSDLYGIYDVESFTRNGQVVAPLVTDTNSWRKIEIDSDGSGWVRHVDNTYFFGFSSNTDRTANKLTLNTGDKRWGNDPIVFVYTYEAPDHLRLRGNFDGAEVTMLLHRVDEKTLRLLGRKFRWTR